MTTVAICSRQLPMSTFTQTLYRNLCGFVPGVRSSRNDHRATGLDGVHRETEILTKDVIYVFTKNYAVQLQQPREKLKSPPNRVCETMRTLITEILASDGQRFEDLNEGIEMEKLSNAPELLVKTVLESMFEDGRIHWLRIVAAYVFAIKLSEKCVLRGRGDLHEPVINTVGEYIKDDIADWVLQQGGWVNVTEVFVDKRDLELKLRSAGYLALAVGVGALLTAVTSR